ncbi:hypothetical protein V6N11_078746 [Hibiscus sabdariffa]|uniref:Sphingomyelin synthase-like domain-containing protein n=1 Tax=Hibiscus sabdariffa TaxID=183260 RepID=A0ABR2RTM8_9ROSI
MTLYIGREASKLWKRICAETTTEINLLLDNWKYVLAGLIFQYIHGLAAHGIHYLHRPGPTLQDIGYFLLPELGQDKAYIMDFPSFHLQEQKDLYSSGLVQGLAYLVASQFLRIISFYSTQLPGPNYHCREGSKIARLPKPSNVLEVLLINFPQGAVYGCGDLIFSSHMIFTLVFVLTYQKFGTRRCIKQFAWLLAIIQSLLILASRKHYTVDVVVAWYTVNLVVFFIDKKLPELPDRSSGNSHVLLPLSTKDKDSKTKEENHKLSNGNSVDPADWAYRCQHQHQHQQYRGSIRIPFTTIISAVVIELSFTVAVGILILWQQCGMALKTMFLSTKKADADRIQLTVFMNWLPSDDIYGTATLGCLAYVGSALVSDKFTAKMPHASLGDLVGAIVKCWSIHKGMSDLEDEAREPD